MDMRRYKVLVVEDNPNDVALLRLALDEAHVDYDLTVIEDGGDALSFVRRAGSDAIPDLAVLDLNLPKRDGIEVLQGMRSNPAFSSVPVAILSSSSAPRDRSRLQTFGVRRYLVKPPDYDEFLKLGQQLKELLPADGE